MCLTAKNFELGFLFNFGPAAAGSAGPIPPPLFWTPVRFGLVCTATLNESQNDCHINGSREKYGRLNLGNLLTLWWAPSDEWCMFSLTCSMSVTPSVSNSRGCGTLGEVTVSS